MAEEFWFARRWPVGSTRNSLATINAKGWAVVQTFIYCMAGGALAALVLVLLGLFVVPFLWVLAPVAYVGAAAYGAWYFISMAQRHGDANHTIDDYKNGQVPPAPPAADGTAAPASPSWRTPSVHAHIALDGYWFAAYKLPPGSGRGILPISWQGFAVIAGFVLSLVLGGLIFTLLSIFAGQTVTGILIFVLFAIGGSATYLWAVKAKSDPEHTVADYMATKGK